LKSNGTETFDHDWLAGDVIVHTTDSASGAGAGPANLVWTSPFSGTVNISGAVWLARDIGRSATWTLWVNTTPITGGSLSSGDPYSRAVPFNFGSGSGGPSALNNISVSVGSTIKLEFVTTSTYGDYTGVNFTITRIQ